MRLLLKAVSAGDEQRVDALIAAGTNVNRRDEHDSTTPLLMAVYMNHVGCATKLIAAGADVHARATRRTEETLQGKTPLHVAAFRGHVACLTALLDGGAEVDCEVIRPWSNFRAYTPLSLACLYNRPACVTELIARGADVNRRETSHDGLTPLHYSALSGAANVAALIAAGADINCLDNHGRTPIDIAALNENLAPIAVLAANGAHVDSAFRLALGKGSPRRVLRALLEAGALPDVSNIVRTESNRSAFEYVDGVLKPALKAAFQMKVRDQRRILTGALRKIFEGFFGREAHQEALAHVARFWMPPEGF